ESEDRPRSVPPSALHRPTSQEKGERSSPAFPSSVQLIGESGRIYGRPADIPFQFWRAAKNLSEAQTADTKTTGSTALDAGEYHLILGTGHLFARHPRAGSGTGQAPGLG